MAHELARRADGRAAIAFVGDTPWHGLGQALTKGADLDTWRREAGLDWSALECPATAQMADGSHLSVPGYKAIIRSDTLKPLAVVGQRYKLVQPAEVLEFFADLVKDSGWYIHTAGALKGGNRIWVMATNDEIGRIGTGDDIITNNLLLATSMDGSLRTTAMETSVRVVCNNTLSSALGGTSAGTAGKDRAIRISHRADWAPEQVKQVLAIRSENFGRFMMAAQELAKARVTAKQTHDVLHRIFQTDNQPAVGWLGNLADRKVQQEASESKGFRSVMALFEGQGMGSDLKTAKGTAWGLLNAVTEYVDHHMGNTPDGRLDAAWFGRGAEIKNRARDLLIEDFVA